MKIVFVIGSLGFGGAERVVSVLANQFYKLGHQVTIITIANNVCKYSINEGIHLCHVTSDTKIKGFSGLRRIIRLRNCIVQNQSDVVISFTAGVSIYVLLARLFAHFTVIVSERNDPQRDINNKFLRFVRNCLYNTSDGFVFQTIDAKKYFSRKIQTRSVVISNPIKPELPERFRGKREHKLIATGRLEKQKNYPLLLKAFAKFLERYPEYILDIYGSGSLKEELNNIVLELGIKDSVVFKGVINNWHEEAKDAEMYILTSDYEGMPNALMEAMSIGLPCISTNCPCGGPSLLIKNGLNGLLVSVNDKSELIKCMNYYVSNRDKAEEMAIMASNSMEKYSEQYISTMWIDFIHRILNIDK